jgi:hypothetical protein
VCARYNPVHTLAIPRLTGSTSASLPDPAHPFLSDYRGWIDARAAGEGVGRPQATLNSGVFTGIQIQRSSFPLSLWTIVAGQVGE